MGPSSDIGEWALCSNAVHYQKLYDSVEPLYSILAPKYRILIYSGDTDGAVPFVGTVGWIANFENGKVPIVEWDHWVSGGQVAGYYTQYDDLTFTTIKGAGHMVPQDNPPVAYDMYTSFIE